VKVGKNVGVKRRIGVRKGQNVGMWYSVFGGKVGVSEHMCATVRGESVLQWMRREMM